MTDASIARVEALPICGMITLRGDLASDALKGAVADVFDLRIPAARGTLFEAEQGICWMSPDELLILCAHDDVPARLDALQKALAGTHALAVDVSDARARFRLSGAGARDVLAKLAPVDLAPGQFDAGMIRRTRLGQIAGAFWMSAPESFEIVCFRSHAAYLEALLPTASAPGSAVERFSS